MISHLFFSILEASSKVFILLLIELPTYLFVSTQLPSEIKYMKSASAIDLKKQQFQSTKERPELDPVLSALINEDIKKSIDAKRHTEYDLSPLSEASKASVEPTTAAPVQTTVKYIPKAQDDSVVVDSIAGSSSEKKQVLMK